MKVIAVIPARYGAKRLPGKPLRRILGKPLVQWVYERTRRAKVLTEVIVATDDKRILNRVKDFGGIAVMTPVQVRTGSDRMFHALQRRSYDWALNVQGDEPLVSPAVINRLIVKAKKQREPAIITAVAPVRGRRELNDPNVVKVVVDRMGRALYFSRSPIPNIQRVCRPPASGLYRHLGIYLYHKKALHKYARERQSFLERMEKLEQLRALETGIPIIVVFTRHCPLHVDTADDIRQVERILRRQIRVHKK
jgi:3-deoxy-manno-octulosonate cytidylyltransferase (CMP-KDO synthetase)